MLPLIDSPAPLGQGQRDGEDLVCKVQRLLSQHLDTFPEFPHIPLPQAEPLWGHILAQGLWPWAWLYAALKPHLIACWSVTIAGARELPEPCRGEGKAARWHPVQRVATEHGKHQGEPRPWRRLVGVQTMTSNPKLPQKWKARSSS